MEIKNRGQKHSECRFIKAKLTFLIFNMTCCMLYIDMPFILRILRTLSYKHYKNRPDVI